jgi:exopolysaccharide biosynthesis polyprenyl glycosylphosphotransferase
MGSFWLALRLISFQQTPLTASMRDLAPFLVSVFLLFVVGFLVLGAMFGLHSRRKWITRHEPVGVAARVFLWSGILAVVFALLLALDPPGHLGRLFFAQALILGVAVTLVSPLAAWLLVRLAGGGKISQRRILLVGADPDSRRVAALLEWGDSAGRRIVGLVDSHHGAAARARRWPRFHTDAPDEIQRLADGLAADEVLVTSPHLDRSGVAALARGLAEMDVETSVVPHLARMFVVGAPVRWENGVPLVRLGRRPVGRWGFRAKRVFDVTVTLVGGLLLLPLMALITLAVKLTSRGPVFHTQTRVGRNGRLFAMYKFRSMIVANDDSRHRRYVASLVRCGNAAGVDSSGRRIYKIVDDPRVTIVGGLLRRMSLDELPQLINVLKGEMSLVGPRPPLPFEYDLYEDWQKERLSVTPGMTGLWQVSGRSFLSFEDMVLLDLYYASNWTFLLDLRTVWRTIPEVLYARGAR